MWCVVEGCIIKERMLYLGGRGAASGLVNRVPNAGKAIIAEAKITKYLLDPTRVHYKEFVAVGYSKNNPEQLTKDLSEGLKGNVAVAFEANEHGDRTFNVDMMLGVTRKARFRTAWQIDKGNNVPRFITAFRIGAKRK